ncbi:transmembrane protein 98-like [Acropora millepora]|uniref:transmembrane protein 98-like n=1 Tax=Acropora millepora TaxID=45264 RepID=UPI001CF201AD|nr:transmembrane protein 98-like [Acropora millepora]
MEMKIALGLLGTLVVASLLTLLLIFCSKRKCGKVRLMFLKANRRQCKNQDTELVKASWNLSHNETNLTGFSPEDNLPEMFLDPDWNGDAESLVSHCIELLKSCHMLTGSLVAYTKENSCIIKSSQDMDNIVAAAKQIQPRVDELVAAMYTPSNSKQIEQSSTGLHKSVCYLLQVVRGVAKRPDLLSWAEEITASIEKHVEAMQLGCQSLCSSCPSIQSSGSSECSTCQQQSTSVITNPAYTYPYSASVI